MQTPICCASIPATSDVPPDWVAANDLYGVTSAAAAAVCTGNGMLVGALVLYLDETKKSQKAGGASASIRKLLQPAVLQQLAAHTAMACFGVEPEVSRIISGCFASTSTATTLNALAGSLASHVQQLVVASLHVTLTCNVALVPPSEEGAMGVFLDRQPAALAMATSAPKSATTETLHASKWVGQARQSA